MSRGGHKPKTGEFKACQTCGKQFWVKKSELATKRFCSLPCRNESYKTGVNAGSVVKVCDFCGEGFTDFPKRTSRFCSQACYWAMKSLEFGGVGNHRWRGGHGKYRGPSWSGQRVKALMRDGHRCQKCGIPACQVHHIVRFGEFDSHEDANKLRNLVTLCSKCHKASGGIECLYQEWKNVGLDNEEIHRRTELWLASK